MAGTDRTFRRGRTTVLAYCAIAAYSYCLYALGPVLPFLREELGLSYTTANLHSTVWVTGTVATGLAYRPLVRRVGRARVFWFAAAGTLVGALAFTVSHTLGLTLLSAAVLGTSGTALQTASFAMLADVHGPQRGRAFVEATVGASAAAVLAPFVLGGLEATRFGWRPGLLAPAAALAVVYVTLGRAPRPIEPGTTPRRVTGTGPSAGHAARLGTGTGPDGIGTDTGARAVGGPSRRLPGHFWARSILVAVVVGVEFCVVFYAASLLHASAGVPTARAATAVGVFYAGELLGRLAGSRGNPNPAQAPLLLTAALGLTLAALVVFWLADDATVAVAALFATGLGVANLYPLALAFAVAAVPARADDAAAATQVLVGAAVLAAPLVLAAAADRVGVVHAFAVEPALVTVGVVLSAAAWYARPVVPRHAPDGPTGDRGDS